MLDLPPKNRMADAAPVERPRSLLAESRVCIVTPLIRDSMTTRLAGWTRKGWKTAGSTPVKNDALPRAVGAAHAVAAAAPTAAA